MDLENIVIDISQKNHITIPSVQCDSNIRFATIKVVNNGKKVDITNYRIAIACKKPDGKIILNDCEKIESKIGLVRFEVTEQIGSVAGMVECELRIYGKGNACLTSQPFNIEVTEPILDATTVVSSNEFRALTKAMSEMVDMNEKFEQKYNEVTTQFNDKYQEVDTQFSTKYTDVGNQFDTKFNEINKQFNDKSTSLDNQFANKMTSITNEFDTKSTNLDKQFKEKYDNLENQYAQNLAGKVDKTEVDVNSVANKIVKRNADGNIYVGHAIEFTTIGQQKYPLEVVDEAHIKIGNRQIWDDENLAIKKGTFSPYGYGSGNSVRFNHTRQEGVYYKVGKQVTIQGRITADNFNGASGEFQIGGLPFIIRESFPSCTLGFYCGIKTSADNVQVTAYGEKDSQYIKFIANDENAGTPWSNITTDKLINSVDILFTMTYLID